MCNPHVLVVPYPGQGHVIPLMEFSQCLVEHDIKVTLVNTEYNHKRVLDALPEKNYIGGNLHLVSIPDGMEPWEDRNELRMLTKAVLRVMPEKLEELIKEINSVEGDKITCIIADTHLACVIEVAEKMKIRRATFCPTAVAGLAFRLSAPKLICDGIINDDGTPIKKRMVQLAPNMPTINNRHLIWVYAGDSTLQKILFERMLKNNEILKMADYHICNSAYDLEPAAFTMVPEILPIGPLLASNRLGNSAGYFWPEDQTCLKWLDQQLPHSVIYAAFGSLTVFNHIQFQELALGLELSNKPFLWVVRSDMTNNINAAYPEGFQDRVGTRGHVVGWAPQQKVLSHPSIACFLSHCGWNSTTEGVSNGIPFLCWPYFADQFVNESYICDIWKVGLKFNKNKNRIIAREEIKNKVDQVFGDEKFTARALELKEIAMNSVRDGGHSNKIFKNFLEWVKA